MHLVPVGSDGLINGLMTSALGSDACTDLAVHTWAGIGCVVLASVAAIAALIERFSREKRQQWHRQKKHAQHVYFHSV